MIVCIKCQRVMSQCDDATTAWVKPTTAWVKQDKKEYACTLVECPKCGVRVLDVNKGSERHAEEPWPGDVVVDLAEDFPEY